MERPATQLRGQMPAQFRLSLSVTPGNAREFDLWRAGMSPLYELDAPDIRTRAFFGAEMTSYQIGDVAIASGHSSAANFQRTSRTIARSGLDNICLVVYSDGGCALDVEGRSAEVHVGDVCILDMTRPGVLRMPNYSSMSVVLPRALLAPYLADIDSLHGQILQRSTPLNAMLVSHLRTLLAEAPALTQQNAHAAAHGTAALIAAFAGASADGRGKIVQAAAPHALQVARQIIEANIHNPELGPDFIGRRLGVSRAKLYRLFEPIGGVSHYIQQRRLQRAYRHIIDPAYANERVGEVAARYGFSSVSVFSRAFRQTYGVPPSEFRAASWRTDTADVGLHGDSASQTMARWLLGAEYES